MNIYALSSGPGTSGIAVIRISGDTVKNVINVLTKSETPSPRVATIKKFSKNSTSELIDEGLLLWFPSPESYTGDDMVEIHVHGSIAVVRAILKELSKIENCRLAEPGEFTKIAFQNGKINLLKAESISDLISAETEIQRQQAVKIMSGRSSEKFNSLRERLLKILSNVEAKIDFPEDDLPKDVIQNIKIDSEKIRKEIETILNDNKVGERIREGFKIAILGPANASSPPICRLTSSTAPTISLLCAKVLALSRLIARPVIACNSISALTDDSKSNKLSVIFDIVSKLIPILAAAFAASSIFLVPDFWNFAINSVFCAISAITLFADNPSFTSSFINLDCSCIAISLVALVVETCNFNNLAESVALTPYQ